MKNIILDFLKGIAIGIANVIPGFSGGTMAVILKIYERFTVQLGNIFNHPIKVIKDIWAILLGLVVGIVLAIFTIVKLLENFPVPTSLFFVGLIIGSVPTIFMNTKKLGKIQIKDVVLFFIAIAIIVILPLINSSSVDTTFNVGVVVIMFVLGVICAASMIIPGISGSLVLMAFGYYLFLMGEINGLIFAVTNNDYSNFTNSLIVVVSFGVGAVLGIVFVSKLIGYLFKKFPRTVYYTIIGLLIASPFAIIYAVVQEYNEMVLNTSPLSWIIGVLAMAISAFLANYISNYKGKNIEKNEINEL